jgi:hypothetical protein
MNSPPAVTPQPQTGGSTSPKPQALQASRREARRSQVFVSRWPTLPQPITKTQKATAPHEDKEKAGPATEPALS